MDTTKCTALIPYTGEQLKKQSVFSSIFFARSNIYVLFAAIAIVFAFGGAFYREYFVSAGSTIKYLDYILYFNKAAAVLCFQLLLFTSVFTVYSPCISTIYFAAFAFNFGYYIFDFITYSKIDFLSIAIISEKSVLLFLSIIFCSEFFLRFKISKCGIKTNLKPKLFFIAALKSILYFLIVFGDFYFSEIFLNGSL
ncbi:MAG: hypothetical protein RR246_00710 [Clostridia bacterium]